MYFYSWYWFAKILVFSTQYFPMYWLIIANLRKYLFFFRSTPPLALTSLEKRIKKKNQEIKFCCDFTSFLFSKNWRNFSKSSQRNKQGTGNGFCRYIIKKPAVFWRVFWIRIKIEESMATVLKTSVLTTEISFSSHHES